MLMSYIHITTVSFFSFLLLVIIMILNAKGKFSRNKNSPFECGFDPKDSARLPFSMRFFLLAVVFLIFDIEVALLFPVIIGLGLKTTMSTYSASLVFLFILMMGLIHEWNQGSLSWVK